MSKETGGPAFPLDRESAINPITDIHGNNVSSGMSLRDWFAGRVAAAAVTNAYGVTEENCDEIFTTLAKVSYKLADALLAERNK